MSVEKGSVRLFVGASGEHAVLSELLIRNYNVAVPDVDLGTDSYVININDGGSKRIQIKTALIRQTKNGWQCGLVFRKDYLRPNYMGIDYLFAPLRDESINKWNNILIIKMDTLYVYLQNNGYDLSGKKKMTIPLKFVSKRNKYYIKNEEITAHIDDWSAWPKLKIV